MYVCAFESEFFFIKFEKKFFFFKQWSVTKIFWLKSLYLFYFSFDFETVWTVLRDWFFSIKLINKNQKKTKNIFFSKYLGANLHEKVSSALETVRPSQKLFIRAINRFAQLRKVLIWRMTSEVRKCPKWRFWGRHFACFLVFPRFDIVSKRF